MDEVIVAQRASIALPVALLVLAAVVRFGACLRPPLPGGTGEPRRAGTTSAPRCTTTSSGSTSPATTSSPPASS
ncbi:MAG: hypothetical protein R2711_06055 [Acidimicrobiales bacterium]